MLYLDSSGPWADEIYPEEDEVREIGTCQVCGGYDFMTRTNGDAIFCFRTDSCKEVGGGDIL